MKRFEGKPSSEKHLDLSGKENGSEVKNALLRVLNHEIPLLDNVGSLVAILGCSIPALIGGILEYFDKIPTYILCIAFLISLMLLHFWEKRVRDKIKSSFCENIDDLERNLEESNDALTESRRRITEVLSELFEERLNVSESMLDAEFDMRGKRDSTYLKDRNALLGDVKSYAEKVVNAASGEFSAYAGTSVRACIKYLKPGNSTGNRIDINAATVTTLVRSSNTQPARRKSSKAVKVAKNSDFREILVGRNGANPQGWFYQGNLLEYDEELKALGDGYDNTTDHWEKFYKGTLVVPICIDRGKLFFVDDQDPAIDILGFLCFDTMETDVFTREKEPLYYAMAADVAAELYPLLSRLKYYLELYEDNQLREGQDNG